MIVTVFKNIWDKGQDNSPEFISVIEALRRIRDGNSREAIESIRTSTSKEEQNKAKMKLPCVCFSGTFPTRKDDSITQHSGLVILDWDEVDVKSTKEMLKQDEHTFSAWVSPRGNGVKALVKIPKEPLNHELYYGALVEKYPELDTTNSNLSRVCYESYDPDIYINENSKVWDRKIEKKVVQEAVPQIQSANDGYIKKCIENVWEKAMEMVRTSPDGHRHEELIKASKLLGGYSGYGISETEAVRVLSSITLARGSDKHYNHEKTISDGFSYGLAKPIFIDVPSKPHKVSVPELSKEEIESIPEHEKILSDQESEREWLNLVFNNKVPQGLSIASEEFDEHFRFKKKTMVGIFGIDNVGKTTFYIFLAVCYAKRHNLKFLLVCRENSAASIRQKIIELYLGKYIHQCNKEDVKKAKDFSYSNFNIIDENYDINIDNFVPVIRKLYEKERYDACFLDPYNAIQHEQTPNKNYKFLGDIRKLQNELDTSFHISMHISTEKARNYVYGDKDIIETFDGKIASVSGQLKIPRKNFVEGGQPIANKMDDIMIVHRIQKMEELRNYTLVSVDKVKEEQTGGMVTFEKPIMFKKQYGFISFVDKDGYNPLNIEPREEKPIPKPTLQQAFGEPEKDYDELVKNLYENPEIDF